MKLLNILKKKQIEAEQFSMIRIKEVSLEKATKQLKFQKVLQLSKTVFRKKIQSTLQQIVNNQMEMRR